TPNKTKWNYRFWSIEWGFIGLVSRRTSTSEEVETRRFEFAEEGAFCAIWEDAWAWGELIAASGDPIVKGLWGTISGSYHLAVDREWPGTDFAHHRNPPGLKVSPIFLWGRPTWFPIPLPVF